jgi:hypothetical protein
MGAFVDFNVADVGVVVAVADDDVTADESTTRCRF